MTNAEKFKEIFDIEVVPENTCLSESCLCHECSHHDGTRCHVEDWWNSEYQGEPTIPLSVIEKIKAEIIQYFMENKDSEDLFLAGCGDGAYHALAIIDKAVKECTNEEN